MARARPTLATNQAGQLAHVDVFERPRLDLRPTAARTALLSAARRTGRRHSQRTAAYLRCRVAVNLRNGNLLTATRDEQDTRPSLADHSPLVFDLGGQRLRRLTREDRPAGPF